MAVTEERSETYHTCVGTNVQKSFLRVLDKIVVVQILDEEPHRKTGVGDCRLEGVDPFSKCPRST